MYTNILVEPIDHVNLMCSPFENLNAQHQQKCRLAFGDVELQNSTIVYSSMADDIVVLGYYILDDANITLSNNYDTFRKFSIRFNNGDPTATLIEMPCVHIMEWVFDNVLRERDRIINIVHNIVFNCAIKGQYIVWFDNNRGWLSYYIISNDLPDSLSYLYASAIYYLTNELISEP